MRNLETVLNSLAAFALVCSLAWVGLFGAGGILVARACRGDRRLGFVLGALAGPLGWLLIPIIIRGLDRDGDPVDHEDDPDPAWLQHPVAPSDRQASDDDLDPLPF